MRDIKFRAWDKITKQIFEVTEINFNAIERNVYGIITYKSILGGVDKSLSFRSFDDVGLMQFTGLKDCKGVEIYEGDIVKLTGNLEKAYKDEHCIISEVIFDDNDLCFDTPKIACALNKHTCFDFEVIGNIYENSELC